MSKPDFISSDDIKFILPIIALIASIIIWGIRLEYKVKANSDENRKQEESLKAYPSSDWFDEKFKNTDKALEVLENKIDNLTSIVEDEKKNSLIQ